MIAGWDLAEGVHGQRVFVEGQPLQEHMQSAQIVGVEHQFLVAHGESALEPARRVQHEIGPAHDGGVERVHRLLHGLGIRHLGTGETAAAADRQAHAPRKLRGHVGPESRLGRAESWRAGPQIDRCDEVAEDGRRARPLKLA